MNRTITVRGTGHITLKPDQIVITLTLRSLKKNYEQAMDLSSKMLSLLKQSLSEIGFGESDLKTARFNVRTEHESICDKNGNYRTVFKGYVCEHDLKLEFDFDSKRLAQVLSAVSGCLADPELSIRFTVKDQNAAADALLQSAAENARHKAQILAASSGVKLGQIVTIDYNWGELNIFSQTDFAMEKRCMSMNAGSIDMNPEDIELSDSAAFVWEIE